MQDHRRRYFISGWHRIIGKGTRQETAVLTVSKLLVECRTHRLREPAEYLAVEQRRVQDPPGIVHCHVFVDAHLSGVAVDLDAAKIENEPIDRRGVDLVGFARRVEPGRRPEYGFAQYRGIGIGEGSGRPMTRPGEPAEADGVVRIGSREDPAIGEPHVHKWDVELGSSDTGE